MSPEMQAIEMMFTPTEFDDIDGFKNAISVGLEEYMEDPSQAY